MLWQSRSSHLQRSTDTRRSHKASTNQQNGSSAEGGTFKSTSQPTTVYCSRAEALLASPSHACGAA